MNESVISKGAFSRIGMLDANHEDIIDSIRSVNEKNANPPKDSPESSFLKLLPLLIKELNGLLEAIIFSDKILIYAGLDGTLIRTFGQEDDFYAPLEPSSWHRGPFVWPEQANSMIDPIVDKMPTKTVALTTPKLVEVLAVLNRVQQDVLIHNYRDVISDKGVDYSLLKFMSDEDRPEGPPTPKGMTNKEFRSASCSKIINGFNNFLDEDWSFFKSNIINRQVWPETILPNGDGNEVLRKFYLDLTLYSELNVALTEGSLSVSNLASGDYYQNFSTDKIHRRYQIKKIANKKYHQEMLRCFEKYSLNSVNLTIPPIFRMCLHQSNTISETVEKALDLRKTPWAKNFRKYIADIANADSYEKQLRHLNRLSLHIDKTLSSVGSMSDFGMGFSTSGNISLSPPSLVERVLNWKNPSIVMHSTLNKALINIDSVHDLERILRLKKFQIVEILRQVDL